MMYVRFPLLRRNVEDLLHERGIDVSYETIHFWWKRFGQLSVGKQRRVRIAPALVCATINPVAVCRWRLYHLGGF